MSEQDDLPMKVATFRFGVIADFVTGVKLEYGDKERLLAEKAARAYEIPGSKQTRISRASMLSWVSKYNNGGSRIEALMPQPRSDRGQYRSLDTTLRIALKGLREENAHYTVPVIIKKLRLAKIIGPDDPVNLATIYRFFRQENLERASPDAEDRRRFEAEHSNQIWQADVLHGPMVAVDGLATLKKSYLMAIIDDHSRMIVHAAFYLSESFEILKDALRQAVSSRGIPQKFYCDNGSCYRSDQLERILASLGIALSHSRPYRPQGRGKIERWFRNIRDSFIPMLPTGPLPLAALNEALDRFVDDYNSTEHSSINQTPRDRYRQDLSCVRQAPERLLDYFRRREYRRVKKDRTVQLQGRIFEVPAKLIDKTVELYFHDDKPDEVEVMHQNLSYGRAVPLNLAVNARGGRDWGEGQERTGVAKNGLQPQIATPPPAEPHGGRLFESRDEDRSESANHDA